MICHTLIYRFPDAAPEAQRQRFLSEMRDLVLESGLVENYQTLPHQWLPADEGARGTWGHAVVQWTCKDLETLRSFSEWPPIHAFVARWRADMGYEVTYANHTPIPVAAPEGTSMRHTEHTVTVDAPVDVVWRVLVDVEGYADIFPPTQAVTILEESPEHQIARLTVDVSGEIQSWVSRRDIDPRRRVISYRQLETAPLMGYMGGEWRALAIDEATTQLVLTHDFRAKDPVDGKVAGKFTPEEAGAILEAAVERNSVADLGAVKDVAERAATESGAS